VRLPPALWLFTLLQFLCVNCNDGGCLDEESVKHLFDWYYRGTSTDTPAGGTGLGMAIVKQIIAAHQGTVDVRSQLKHGTLITVRIPCEM
jgi:signal transduction histidine kinase